MALRLLAPPTPSSGGRLPQAMPSNHYYGCPSEIFFGPKPEGFGRPGPDRLDHQAPEEWRAREEYFKRGIVLPTWAAIRRPVSQSRSRPAKR